jgi:hypothetical protein
MRMRRNESAAKREREVERRQAEAGGHRSERSACEPWKPIDFEGQDTSLTQAELALMK